MYFVNRVKTVGEEASLLTLDNCTQDSALFKSFTDAGICAAPEELVSDFFADIPASPLTINLYKELRGAKVSLLDRSWSDLSYLEKRSNQAINGMARAMLLANKSHLEAPLDWPAVNAINSCLKKYFKSKMAKPSIDISELAEEPKLNSSRLGLRKSHLTFSDSKYDLHVELSYGVPSKWELLKRKPFSDKKILQEDFNRVTDELGSVVLDLKRRRSYLRAYAKGKVFPVLPESVKNELVGLLKPLFPTIAESVDLKGGLVIDKGFSSIGETESESPNISSKVPCVLYLNRCLECRLPVDVEIYERNLDSFRMYDSEMEASLFLARSHLFSDCQSKEAVSSSSGKRLFYNRGYYEPENYSY